LTVVLLLAMSVLVRGQGVPLEYRVKAAYLYNFIKFVDWPSRAPTGPVTICIAGRNPFGDVLTETIQGESVNGRPLQIRVVLEPDSSCHVLFVPQGGPAATYLRAARGSPLLTVGESRDFIAQGGIINFIVEDGSVRFEIDADAAERAELKISSRLLRLARVPERRASR
jgi:hypothetical protein